MVALPAQFTQNNNSCGETMVWASNVGNIKNSSFSGNIFFSHSTLGWIYIVLILASTVSPVTWGYWTCAHC